MRGILYLISLSTVFSQHISVYFGAGCFWHMQHSFIVAEQEILKRDANSLTSLTGYAGSTDTDPSKGVVCYHNGEGLGDYGQLGHAEVVHMTIPETSYADFCKVFADQFTNGIRRDPQDRGGEYRSLVGIPGGMGNTELVNILQPALEEAGLALEESTAGSDGDTLESKVVYVMDTEKFPFYQAEMWHQFHDDMIEHYDAAYHKLKDSFKADCRVHPTGCPDKEGSSCAENHEPITGTTVQTQIGMALESPKATHETSDNNGIYIVSVVLAIIIVLCIAVAFGARYIHQQKLIKESVGTIPNYSQFTDSFDSRNLKEESIFGGV